MSGHDEAAVRLEWLRKLERALAQKTPEPLGVLAAVRAQIREAEAGTARADEQGAA